MLDWIFPWILVAVWLAIIFWPDGEEVEDVVSKQNEELNRKLREALEWRAEFIDYGAFKGLTDEEFTSLPQSIKPYVPDKCRWCGRIFWCDPLEMALSDGYCEGFRER